MGYARRIDRQHNALEKLKQRNQVASSEWDELNNIILPVNSWEYRLQMSKEQKKKAANAGRN